MDAHCGRTHKYMDIAVGYIIFIFTNRRTRIKILQRLVFYRVSTQLHWAKPNLTRIFMCFTLHTVYSHTAGFMESSCLAAPWHIGNVPITAGMCGLRFDTCIVVAIELYDGQHSNLICCGGGGGIRPKPLCSIDSHVRPAPVEYSCCQWPLYCPYRLSIIWLWSLVSAVPILCVWVQRLSRILSLFPPQRPLNWLHPCTHWARDNGPQTVPLTSII